MSLSCMLHSDGRAWLNAGQYTQVSAGGGYTMLLRNDGTAFACGLNDVGQCNIPWLEEGVTYKAISAGFKHSVLLRSDGKAVACGLNDCGQCNIPELEEGMTYKEISAGFDHTLLLRSDGEAVACGGNEFGQCNLHELSEEVTYVEEGVDSGHPHGTQAHRWRRRPRRVVVLHIAQGQGANFEVWCRENDEVRAHWTIGPEHHNDNVEHWCQSLNHSNRRFRLRFQLSTGGWLNPRSTWRQLFQVEEVD